MARKGWDALKASTRERYEKNGITRESYDAGASLNKARGHGQTPERPKGYDKSKYRKYHQSRQKLVDDVIQRKKDLFGDRPRFNEQRSKDYLYDYPPPIKLLRWVIQASDEEILDAISEDPQTYAFLGYH